jgi:hypothetical protein
MIMTIIIIIIKIIIIIIIIIKIIIIMLNIYQKLKHNEKERNLIINY